MKISKTLVATACVTACLSLAAVALAQTSSTSSSAKKASSSASTKSTSAQHHMTPVSSTSTVTATVVSVDMKTRKVTLKDDNGAEYSFVAESSVKNLGQVKPGDIVTSTYTESVAYVVKSEGGAPGMTASQGMTTAPAGEKPAAVATSKTTVTVAVTAIDPKGSSVTFKGPQGNMHTVKVQDPEKLEGVKVGDMVDVNYTEVLSIKVHTPKKM
jgi:Cu/Ag efflux protein CusF